MKSYVDSITNTTVLSQIDLQQHLGQLLKFDASADLIPSLLHEGMHHECFWSPVGTTLALLRMRAYRRAIAFGGVPLEELTEKNDEDYHWLLLQDVIRQEATTEILRPLSEGLACFEEFDARPGESNVISDSMRNIFFYFGGRDKVRKLTSDSLNQFLHSQLYHLRFSTLVLERREAVLAKRFDLAEGGYLPGYMVVKSLFNLARKRSNQAHDSELFAAWLRCYFYNDYSLVAILLNPDTTEHASVTAIAEHFKERMIQLTELDIDGALTQFEAAFSKPGPISEENGLVVRGTRSEGLGIDSQLEALGRERLLRLTREMVLPQSQDPTERQLADYDARRLQKRGLMCLGSLDTDIKVNEHQRVIVGRTTADGAWLPIFAAQARDGVSQGSAVGALEFYLIPDHKSQVIAATRAGEIVFVHFDGPITTNKEHMAWVTGLLGPRSEDLAALQKQEEYLEAVIRNCPVATVRDHYKAEAKNISGLYARFATLTLPEDQWKASVDRLEQGGLYELFDHDAVFLRGLAFVGAFASVEPLVERLREGGKLHDVDVDWTIARALEIKQSTGIETLRVKNGVCFSLL